jgi:hypothetical protein
MTYGQAVWQTVGYLALAAVMYLVITQTPPKGGRR